ncbi:MAG TPA: alpha/beta fold hydrolase [Candidatus Pacearchaeota archaeon]|nr:alpha/beta fold hydrolase [Candidatus Pacearchaeota archaeon]
MRWIGRVLLIIAIGLAIVFFKIELPETTKAILISIIGGILIFNLVILFSKVTSLDVNKKKKARTKEEKEKKKRKVYRIAFIFMIISMPLFFNFYLYFKALVGNDLLISLDVPNQNFILKNGGEQELDVRAKVLINPFCSANCSIVLEDLAKNEIIDYENMNVGVSTPFSKEYLLRPNEEKAGEKLYKLTLECNTIKDKKFCYVTSDLPKSRTKIISIKYELNDIQQIRKEKANVQLKEVNEKIYKSEYILNNLNFNYSLLDLSNFENESISIKENTLYFLTRIQELNNLYSNQEYSELEKEILNTNEEINRRSELVDALNSSLINSLTEYNLIVEGINSIYEEIILLKEYNFTLSSITTFEQFIEEFNLAVIEIEKKDNLENKIILFNQLKENEEKILFAFQNESPEEIFGDQKIKNNPLTINIEKIQINYGNYSSDFNLPEPPPICCFREECYPCIENSSYNYPVILVHGHSFNEKLSAELSMEAFSDMAQALEKDGYLDAGYFYGNQYEEISKGYLGKINKPIVVKATYYIDTLTTEENSFILDSKWENIDTYATRLNEVVSNIKYLTGKDKVIIVAHSMGCLVTRKYIQMYGEENLDKIILIGGPNHGIDGFILKSCPIFGADIECNEMNKDSLFISELNNATPPSIPVYNLIGTGCSIEEYEADGIVKSESSYLDWADNIYVQGNCNGVDFFHVRMIKPTYHPEIYKIVKEKIES